MAYVTRQEGGKAKRILGGIAEGLKGVSKGMLTIEDIKRQKEELQLRKDEFEMRREKMAFEIQDRSFQMFNTQLGQLLNMSKEGRKVRMEDPAYIEGMQKIYNRSGNPGNMIYLINDLTATADLMPEVFTELQGVMNTISSAKTLTPQQGESLLGRAQKSLDAVSSKIGAEGQAFLFQNFQRMQKAVSDKVTNKDAEFFGYIKTKEGTLEPIEKRTEAIGMAPTGEFAGTGDRRGQIYELPDEKETNNRKQDTKDLITKAYVAIKRAQNQAQKLPEAREKYTLTGRLAKFLKSEGKLSESSTFMELLERGEEFEGKFTKEIFSELGEVYGTFAQAQILGAKAIVKAFDGSRPSDFDFRVIIENVMPRIGEFDSVKAAKFEQLLGMLRLFGGEVTGSDVKSDEARINMMQKMAFGDSVDEDIRKMAQEQFENSDEEDTKRLWEKVKKQQQDPGTVKVDFGKDLLNDLGLENK